MRAQCPFVMIKVYMRTCAHPRHHLPIEERERRKFERLNMSIGHEESGVFSGFSVALRLSHSAFWEVRTLKTVCFLAVVLTLIYSIAQHGRIF